MRTRILAALLLCLSLAPAAAGVPRYAHIFIVIEENRTADQIIGNRNAPRLNRLARQYGWASNYFAVAHPSEPNYVALLGGDTFGIADDDAYWCRRGLSRPGCPHAFSAAYADHTVTGPGLADQLAKRGVSWRGYFQSLPRPGSPVAVWPRKDELYAVKHNGFMNFRSVQRDRRRGLRIVGFDALDRDIARGTLPAFAVIVPDLCHDMHGTAACADDTGLVRNADALAGQIVDKITATPLWRGPDNCAIVITFDENGGDSAAHANSLSSLPSAGGWIATIVVTNHGPRGLVDPAPYDHYSLLRTVEDAFGIGMHLRHAADAAAMVPLFAMK